MKKACVSLFTLALLTILLLGFSALAEEPVEALDEWTILFYFCGSDLESKYSYATVNLYIDEVKILTETQEQTVWQRIGSGFGENLRNIGEDIVDFFIWLVTYSPQLIVIGGIIWLVIRTVRRAIKKRRARKTEE